MQKKLYLLLKKGGHRVKLVHKIATIDKRDCAVFLSCEKIIPKSILRLNEHNIVPHSSNLPRGKGWSPLSWQIIEGKNQIVDSLFEATEKVDSGQIYFQKIMSFKNHELIDECRKIQGETDIELVLKFIDSYPPKQWRQQVGKESFYRRRNPSDSELDVHKTIAQQFDLLRIVDNIRYPAFFKYRSHEYIIKIYKKK